MTPEAESVSETDRVKAYERADFEIRNLPRWSLHWEWMCKGSNDCKCGENGEYLERDEVLAILERAAAAKAEAS